MQRKRPLMLLYNCLDYTINERRRLPIKYDIISSYGLKENDIESYKSFQKANELHVYITLHSYGQRCPICGKYTKKVKGYSIKKIIHSVLISMPCTIHYRARRYICTTCTKTFHEDNPFCDKGTNLSTDTIHNILKLLKEYNQTFSSVARTLHISKTKVLQIFDEHVQPLRKPLSRSICLDEFYFSRKAKKKYAFLILNFTRGNIIDMLESREKRVISNYLRSIPVEERNLVEYVSIDMNDIYRELVYKYFNNACVCADSFHVIKLINTALDTIRKRVMKRYEHNKKSNEYYILKYRRDLLYSDVADDTFSKPRYNHHFKYAVLDKRKLEMLLVIDRDLAEAYSIKEAYSLFNSAEYDMYVRQEVLESLIERFLSSNIEEIIQVGGTLTRWKQEILNSFVTITKKVKGKDGISNIVSFRVSNEPIEGRNKYIKIILKLANGYSNFQRFKNRCMYCLNRFEKYSEDKLTTVIKRKIK